MYIKTFENLNKGDAAVAGGKGASLGEMTQAGIPVPPGFVVTAETFDQFIRDADVIQEIDAALDTVDTDAMHTVDDASERIQAVIRNAEMSSEMKGEIDEAFESLGAEFVAVRSSATAEDGADHAWAGQLDSHMNVTRQNVSKMVRECWASLFTPRAIFYRFEKGLQEAHISVAVVVQKMVQSEVAGIAFSIHPVTEDNNQMICEAGWGFGDAIVSGSVTPDSYVVEKRGAHSVERGTGNEQNILDINVSEQEKMLVKKSADQADDPEWGQNVWTDVPAEKKEVQKLTEEQIYELGDLVQKIEKHYGFPCDIEWAVEGGTFYITQSRPITTLP